MTVNNAIGEYDLLFVIISSNTSANARFTRHTFTRHTGCG